MNELLQVLCTFDIYKRQQGRIVRQVTAFALAIICLLGLWQLYVSCPGKHLIQFVVIPLLGLLACWFAFRLVCMPSFADFLIQVEAEMRKVSWPTRSELIAASTVVIIVMFFLAALLFGYDCLINWLFTFCSTQFANLFKFLGIF